MSKIAYVFPGQGSQYVGMGYDIYRSSKQARKVFDEADSILGFPLSKLCFDGPKEEHSQTINAQPAVLVTSIAYLKASGLCNENGTFSQPPAFLAGHSLGEYTALIPANILSFHEALCLARARGMAMQNAGKKAPGSMAAIIGLDEELVKSICQRTGVEIANINSSTQIVISGPQEMLESSIELAIEKGARRAVRLEVSAAFHSSLMQPAVDTVSQYISEFSFRCASIPIVANTTVQPISEPMQIRAELLNQLCGCVHWHRSVEYMIKRGVSTFIEVGPGQVLSGLIKRIDSQVQILKV